MISIVINADTRKGSELKDSEQLFMTKVTVSFDYLIEGVRNKIDFFSGYDCEIILYIDRHLDVPSSLFTDNYRIKNIPLTICISDHQESFDDQKYFPKWNDMNYLRALYLARGEYIVHFDQDMAAFKQPNSLIIKQMLSWLNIYKFISYPSHWSPNPEANDNNWEYWWASTRFFLCKRSQLNFTELEKCLRSSEYLYNKYGDMNRKCPWLEHILGIIAKKNYVYYPPINLNDYAIFCWSKYQQGLYSKLNNKDYNEIKHFIEQNGGISYPCDVRFGG